MAYRIVYGKDPVRSETTRFWSGRMRVMTALFFVMFILSVKLLWKDGFDILQDVLLPGAGDTALKAMNHMVAHIREGSGLTDAVTAFCREIIAGAKLG